MSGYNEILFESENTQVIHEFDTKSFQASAYGALNNNPKSINFKTSFYSKTIADTINGIKDITLDSEAVKEFAHIQLLSGGYTPIRPIDYSDVTVINSKELTKYSSELKDMLENLRRSEDFSKDEVLQHTSPDILDNYKKDAVKTTLNTRSKIDELVNSTTKVKKIIPDSRYITSSIIPFVNGFNTAKNNLIKEGKDILLDVTECESSIETILKYNEVDHNVNKMNYAVYNSAKSLIELLSWVTFMYVRKVNNFRTNVLNCNRLYTEVMNKSTVTESEIGLDTGVLSVTPANLGFNMLQGNVGAYTILANKVYELYTGKNKVSDIDDVVRFDDGVPNRINGEYTQGVVSYSDEVYMNTVKALIGIGQGLYNICQIPTGMMIRKDDVIYNSGFKLPLKDKFRSMLTDITDVSKIHYADVINAQNIDKASVDELLSEVKDYTNNMKKISNEAIDAKLVLDEIIKRFDYNINNAFKVVDSVKEIEEWANMFKDEYIEFINEISKRYMERLAYLAITLKKINNQMESSHNNEDIVSTAFSFLDLTDYKALESYYDFGVQKAMNQLELLAMEKEYLRLYTKKRTGHNLVFEADENTEKPGSGKIQILSKGNISNAINKITEKIGEWIGKIKNLITSSKDKILSDPNYTTFVNDLGLVENMDCTGKEVKMLPYQNMPPNSITTAIDDVSKNIAAWTPQNIQGFSDENTVISNAFKFINGFNPSNDIKTQFQWYAKVGSVSPTDEKIYSGNELKEQLPSMCEFVRNYPNGYNSTLQSTIDNLKNALDKLANSCKTVDVKESALFEADDNTNTNTADKENKNTQGSMSKKVAAVNKAVNTFTTVMTEEAKNRYNKYCEALSGFINQEKASVNSQNNNQNNTQSNNQNNT